MGKSRGYPQKANCISFWGFIFSIIFYVSIFCFFNIHPYTIINTTKFWFFISNTLILFIAADFGAFSSSGEDDLYEEYVNKTQVRCTTISSFEIHYTRGFEKKLREKDHIIYHKTEEQEEIKDVFVDEKCAIIKADLEKEAPPQVDEKNLGKKEEKTICLRTNSEKAIMVENEERKICLQRSKSEKHEVHQEVEESEFSTMSIEELNRRIEEFIQKFNRQIRLQAARNRKNLEVPLYLKNEKKKIPM